MIELMSNKARERGANLHVTYFVTGIDTDSGKTLAAAILCEALEADYWKPVQAGMPTDSETVRRLVTNTRTIIHKETFLLNTPASPHAAAKLDGIQISLSDFRAPTTANDLIIEGAGGCLVPLNDRDFIIDLAAQFDAETILVADLYLGSINHTLLTFNELRRRNASIKGIIFNGEHNSESENDYSSPHGTEAPIAYRRETHIDCKIVRKYADELLKN